MLRMRQPLLWTAVLTAALVLTACGDNGRTNSAEDEADGSGPLTLTSTQYPFDITTFCMNWSVARSEGPGAPGFKEKENIELDLVTLDIPQVTTAVNGHDVDLGECSGFGTVVNAWEQGADDIVVVAAGSVAPMYQLIAQPKFRTPEDLRGGDIGIPGEASASAEAAYLIMDAEGMSPGEDYEFVQAGSGSARVAAMQAGQLDAVTAFPPDSYALLDEGFSLIADEKDYVPDYVTGVYIANRTWAEENREDLVRWLKVLVQSGRWLDDPANKEEVIEWLAANYEIGGQPISQDYAERTYEFGIEGERLASNGYAPIEALQANIDVLLERGQIQGRPPVDEIFDYSYLNDALQELGLSEVDDY